LPQHQRIHQGCHTQSAGNPRAKVPKQPLKQSADQRTCCHAGKEADPSEKTKKHQREYRPKAICILRKPKITPKA
jgi:hypothetical protein